MNLHTYGTDAYEIAIFCVDTRLRSQIKWADVDEFMKCSDNLGVQSFKRVCTDDGACLGRNW